MYCLTSFEFAKVPIVLHFLIGQTVTVLEAEFEQQPVLHMLQTARRGIGAQSLLELEKVRKKMSHRWYNKKGLLSHIIPIYKGSGGAGKGKKEDVAWVLPKESSTVSHLTNLQRFLLCCISWLGKQ
jgi:hypothetical protein